MGACPARIIFASVDVVQRVQVVLKAFAGVHWFRRDNLGRLTEGVMWAEIRILLFKS